MNDRAASYFLHVNNGESFPVPAPVAWCLAHADSPLLGRARQRLLLCNPAREPQRILNVVFRRCGLNLAELRPGQLVVHHWTREADLRPFCKEHAQARADVQVARVRHKDGRVFLGPGDDFRYGERAHPAFPWGLYREQWERRHVVGAGVRSPAPTTWSAYQWEGVDGIPWSALRSLWRNEPGLPCPNDGAPLWVWRFDWRRRTLLSRAGGIWRACFVCERLFPQPAGDLWPWLAATLDPEVLPDWHDGGFGKSDLRSRR